MPKTALSVFVKKMNEINDLAKNPCPICDLIKLGLLVPIDPNQLPPWEAMLEIGGMFYKKGETNDEEC